MKLPAGMLKMLESIKKITGNVKLTLFKRLLAGFGVVLLLLLAISITAMSNMRSMGEKSNQTTEIGLPNVILINNLNYDLKQLDDLLLRIQLNLQEESMDDELLSAGLEGTEKQSQTDKAKSLFDSISAQTDKLAATAVNDKDAKLISLFQDNWKSYQAVFPSVLKAVQSHGSEGMMLIRQTDSYLSGCTTVLYVLAKNNQDHAVGWGGELTSAYKAGLAWVIALSILAIIVGLGISFVFARQISNPIRHMSEAAKRVSEGDLTADSPALERHDEIGELSVAFATMTGHMREVMLKLNVHAKLVAESAEQLMENSGEMQISSQAIATTVKDVSEGAEQQTVSMEETNRSMEEVGVGIGRLAENSSSIAESVEWSRQQAENGGVSVQSTVLQMRSIDSSVQRTDSFMEMLELKSKQIGGILNAIREIAQQTNLLALNASIEAARAGEHGRGFAVVASEIRRLAEQSGESSNEIDKLLNHILANIRESGEAMGQVKQEVAIGLERVQDTEQNFQHILESTSQIVTQVQEMAAVSQQMAASAQEITATSQQVAEIARKTSHASLSVVESAETQLKTVDGVQSSAQTLARMTDELHTILTQFKVS